MGAAECVLIEQAGCAFFFCRGIIPCIFLCMGAVDYSWEDEGASG